MSTQELHPEVHDVGAYPALGTVKPDAAGGTRCHAERPVEWLRAIMAATVGQASAGEGAPIG